MLRVSLVLLGCITLAIGAMGLWGPREPAPLNMQFDEQNLGADLDAYLRHVEAQKDDILPGVEKRIIWAGETGERTKLSIVYVHGFSATSEEIRPVPDQIAGHLGANLFYTRLAGHGRRAAEAMAQASVASWMRDMAEALAIGRWIGEKTLLIGTSTGSTLISAAAAQPGALSDVLGIIMVSPNFQVANPAAQLLTWPGARWWAPYIAGETYSFEPLNDAQAKYWTTSYPTVAALPMAALVDAVSEIDYNQQDIPLLVIFSDADRVVLADAIRAFSAQWGGGADMIEIQPGEGIDPYAHVLAGTIMSPGSSEAITTQILSWIARHNR